MDYNFKYKVGDVIDKNHFICTIKHLDYHYYDIEYYDSNNIKKYTFVDAIYLDAASKLELKYSRKEKLKIINES